ncbi:hypothetical protein EBU71_03365 [bacterium]|nr:hypothetical protein [Candidatus Elulimicrobium humile]
MARNKKQQIPIINTPQEDYGNGETKFTPEDTTHIDQKIIKQVANFTELLDGISSVEEKTKHLWRQIYENAVQDRKNAYIMWIDLYGYVHSNPNEHAIHGQNLARYMERMSKANDQILKLTELVSKASEEDLDEMMSEDDIYERIQKTTTGLKQ